MSASFLSFQCQWPQWTENYVQKNGSLFKWLALLFDRNFLYSDPYLWKNSCLQLCAAHDSRSCNEQSCPINCRLTEFGPWSICSPCVQKQAFNCTTNTHTHTLNRQSWSKCSQPLRVRLPAVSHEGHPDAVPVWRRRLRCGADGGTALPRRHTVQASRSWMQGAIQVWQWYLSFTMFSFGKDPKQRLPLKQNPS